MRLNFSVNTRCALSRSVRRHCRLVCRRPRLDSRAELKTDLFYFAQFLRRKICVGKQQIAFGKLNSLPGRGSSSNFCFPSSIMEEIDSRKACGNINERPALERKSALLTPRLQGQGSQAWRRRLLTSLRTL